MQVGSFSMHGNQEIIIGGTVILRLTSDPANEFFGLKRFFFAIFRTRLTKMDSANECFSERAR
jgi:molecular chaperone DnaK (HSP70)